MSEKQLKHLNFKHRHSFNDIHCDACEPLDYEIDFPIACPCGGIIHCDSWGYSDEYEGFAYYTLECDTCGMFSCDFGTGDAYDEPAETFLKDFLATIESNLNEEEKR